MFDLNDLKASLTLDHEVEHPTLGRTGWVITFAGDAHPATKAAMRALLDKRAKRKTASTAANEQDGTDLLVARTLGWSGLVSNGEEVPYSHAKAEEIFSEPPLEWIKRQVIEALGDDSLFFKS